MNIAQALQVQKSLTNEISRLRDLAKQDAYRYVVRDPGANWEPSFDLEANHDRIKELSKLHARIGQAIAKVNLTTELDIDDIPYKDWF